MFRNDKQINQVCLALLARIGQEKLWDENGPTAMAIEWKESSPLSRGERIMLGMCFDLWNCTGGLRLADILCTLDEGHTQAVCSVLVAAKRGPEAVDEWLTERVPALKSAPEIR